MDRVRGGGRPRGSASRRRGQSSTSHPLPHADGSTNTSASLPTAATTNSTTLPASTPALVTTAPVAAASAAFVATSSPVSETPIPIPIPGSSQRGRSRTGINPSSLRTSGLPSDTSPSPRAASYSFTLSTPSPTMPPRGVSTRKKARAVDSGIEGAPGDETVSKGGHSLRKRAPVNYSHMEHGDDIDYALNDIKTPVPASARSRKRRAATDLREDEDAASAAASAKKPRVSHARSREVASPVPARRKRPAKKTTAPSAAIGDQHSDNDVKDTIEVGVSPDGSAYSDQQSPSSQSEAASSESRQSAADKTRGAPLPMQEEALETETQSTAVTVPEVPSNIIDDAVGKAVLPELPAATEQTRQNGSDDLINNASASTNGHHAAAGPAKTADSALASHVEVAGEDVDLEIEAPGRDAKPAANIPEAAPDYTGQQRARSRQTNKSTSSATNNRAVDSHTQERAAVPSRVVEEEALVKLILAHRKEFAKRIVEQHIRAPTEKPIQAASSTGQQHGANASKATIKEGKQQAAKAEKSISDHAADSALPSSIPASSEPTHDEAADVAHPPAPVVKKAQETAKQQVGEQLDEVPAPTAPAPEENEEAQATLPELPAIVPDEIPEMPRRTTRRSSTRIASALLKQREELAAESTQKSESTKTAPRSQPPSRADTLRPVPSATDPNSALPSPTGKTGKTPAQAVVASPPLPDKVVKLRQGLSPYVDGVAYYPESFDDDEGPAEVVDPAAEPDEEMNGDVVAENEPENADEAYVDLRGGAEGDTQGSAAGGEAEGSADLIHTRGGSLGPSLSQEPAAVDSPVPDANQTGAGEVAEETPQPSMAKKRYRFKQLRDPKDFIDALKGHKSMETEDLENCLAVVNEALCAWQDEFKELRKITDDEDNAVRRRQQDATFESKTAAAIRRGNPETDVIERDFQVKGSRQREEITDVKRQRDKEQDKLMSQVYFFEYDARDTMISKQDPIAQREGIQNTRLRNRPKQTQKAAEAEAEETLGAGKRIRRKRILDDESQAPSRAVTPATASVQPPARRRQRRGAGKTAAVAEEEDGANDAAVPEVTAPENVPGEPVEEAAAAAPEPQVPARGKWGGRRQRGAKSHLSEALAAQDVEPVAEENSQPVVQEEEKPKPTRKRRRKAEDAVEPSGPVDTVEPAHGSRETEELPPPIKRPRINIVNHNGSNGSYHSGPVEIASSSFYTNPSEATAESRPSTSSSNATVATVDSGYSLRSGRHRIIKEDERAQVAPSPAAARPNKRLATGEISSRAPAPVPIMPQPIVPNLPQPNVPLDIAPAPAHLGYGQIPLAPAPAPATMQAARPKTTLKIKNYTPSSVAPPPLAGMQVPTHIMNLGSGPASRVPTPIPIPMAGPPMGGDNGDDGEKDYRQMTKSEKMSHSMKTRWANGSMQAAVAKRKATLAAKKAAAQHAVATTPASEASPAPNAPAEVPSAAGMAGMTMTMPLLPPS